MDALISIPWWVSAILDAYFFVGTVIACALWGVNSGLKNDLKFDLQTLLTAGRIWLMWPVVLVLVILGTAGIVNVSKVRPLYQALYGRGMDFT